MNKKFFFAFLFLFLPKLVLSQATDISKINLTGNDQITFLDSLETMTLSKEYKYIKVIKDYKLDKESYVVLQYYKSGALRMRNVVKDKNRTTKDGDVTFYYENGNKKSVIDFIKGRAIGKDFQWYENGNKKLEGENTEDTETTTLQKINQFWDANGNQKVTDGNGFFEDTSENESSKGEVKNGFKEGDWEGYLFKLKSSYKETYKNGKLISGISTDKNGIQYPYRVLEKAPEHKKEIDGFYQYIGQYYKTPEVQGLKGKVYVTFTIDTDGIIIDPKAIKDIGYGTGKEAVRILTNYNGFKPGEQRGQKVKCTYSLPINIRSSI